MIVRGSMFMQNFRLLIPTVVSKGVLAAPMGIGRCAFVDCADRGGGCGGSPHPRRLCHLSGDRAGDAVC